MLVEWVRKQPTKDAITPQITIRLPFTDDSQSAVEQLIDQAAAEFEVAEDAGNGSGGGGAGNVEATSLPTAPPVAQAEPAGVIEPDVGQPAAGESGPAPVGAADPTAPGPTPSAS